MFRKPETVHYPEERRPTAPRFHGHHQLNRWPDGLEKCIGCELCAWACPADAIYVEGRDNTADERYSPGERYGAVYQINYLRCILCGLCIEACPTRALTMTNEYEIADDSREHLIWTKEQLLVPLLPDMEAPPHPMRLGDDEKDYYRLGAAGLTVGPRAPGMSGPGGPSGPPGSAPPAAGRPAVPRGAGGAAIGENVEEGRATSCGRRRTDHVHATAVRPPSGSLAIVAVVRRAGHDPGPAGGALRDHARRGDALPGHHVRHAGRALPRLRADHRLHRRGADAVPVRHHADRHQLVGLDRGDDQGPAGGRRARRDRPVRDLDPRHRARGHRPGRAGPPRRTTWTT